MYADRRQKIGANTLQGMAPPTSVLALERQHSVAKCMRLLNGPEMPCAFDERQLVQLQPFGGRARSMSGVVGACIKA